MVCLKLIRSQEIEMEDINEWKVGDRKYIMIRNELRNFIEDRVMICITDRIIDISRGSFAFGWFSKSGMVGRLVGIIYRCGKFRRRNMFKWRSNWIVMLSKRYGFSGWFNCVDRFTSRIIFRKLNSEVWNYTRRYCCRVRFCVYGEVKEERYECLVNVMNMSRGICCFSMRSERKNVFIEGAISKNEGESCVKVKKEVSFNALRAS